MCGNVRGRGSQLVEITIAIAGGDAEILHAVSEGSPRANNPRAGTLHSDRPSGRIFCDRNYAFCHDRRSEAPNGRRRRCEIHDASINISR